jgi:hypothetical protein
MSQSTTSAPTFLCYVLGSTSLPRVSEVFQRAYGKSPEAVGLFAGPSDTWEGASINHVLFRRLRVSVDRLPDPVQQAAAGRPPPTFVLEATSTVPQPPEMSSFIAGNLLRAVADITDGIVADPSQGLLYTGDSSRAQPRTLPWDHSADPDPEADDWSDVL